MSALPLMLVVNGDAYTLATPAALADVFCAMDSHQQAEFFQAIAENTEEWGSYARTLQWAAMALRLSPEARSILSEMAAAAEAETTGEAALLLPAAVQ